MLDWIFGYSDTYMPLLALIVLLIIRKNIEKHNRIFFFYLAVNVVLFGITNIMAHNKINNLFLYHFYYLFELIFVSWYLTKYLIKSSRPLFLIVAGCYTLFWLIDISLWESLNVFSSLAAGLQKIIILFLCMYYMLILSRSERILRFQKLPEFWIASAYLVSCAMGILSVVAYKYYEQNKLQDSGIHAWIIESIGIIIKFTFLITAFLCYKRRHRSHYQSLSLL